MKWINSENTDQEETRVKTYINNIHNDRIWVKIQKRLKNASQTSYAYKQLENYISVLGLPWQNTTDWES